MPKFFKIFKLRGPTNKKLKVIIGALNRRNSMVEKQFQTICFRFLTKAIHSSEDLIPIESWFQIVGAASEKARLPIFSLVLGTRSILEPDDLRVLEISEKYSRVTKYVCCSVEIVRYVTVANFNLFQYTIRSQCNCLSSVSDGEKRHNKCS